EKPPHGTAADGSTAVKQRAEESSCAGCQERRVGSRADRVVERASERVENVLGLVCDLASFGAQVVDGLLDIAFGVASGGGESIDAAHGMVPGLRIPRPQRSLPALVPARVSAGAAKSSSASPAHPIR